MHSLKLLFLPKGLNLLKIKKNLKPVICWIIAWKRDSAGQGHGGYLKRKYGNFTYNMNLSSYMSYMSYMIIFCWKFL